MTRKKSNVKALAIAVTCAILAGGGIGLKPVYAVQALYKDNYKGYITADDSGATGGADATKWKLTVINSGLKIGGIDLGLTNPNAITIGSNTITETDVANWNSVYSTVGNSSGGLVKDVADNKTNIETNKANIATKADQTALNTANGKITALEGKTIKFNNDGTTLTGMEEVGANKVSATKLAVGGKEINADTVAGYDAAVSKTANITYDATHNVTYINEGTAQQVVIDEKGLKVGKNSSRMNDDTGFATSKNLYVGTADAENPTAANSKFYVNGATGETVVNGTDGKTTVYGGGITIDSAVGNQHVLINSGTVNASASVVSPDFFVDPNNDFKKNSLKVGDGTKGVTIEDGAITTTGDATVGGNLQANKNAFVKGMLTVDGNIEGKGALKGKTLGIGTNGSEFTVDENGAVKAAGGKVEIDKTGKATFGENANNRTTIAGKLATFGENTSTDYTTINGGKLNTYDLTVRNDMTVKNFKADNITSTNRITVGADANEVYLDANGTLSLGTDANQKLGKTQLANINDTIKSGKVIDATSATIGHVAINGDDVTTATGTIKGNTITDGNGFTATGGKITAKDGEIGGVVINTAGEVTGVKSIKASTFKVDEENYLNGNGITAKSITAKGGKIGGAVIDATTLTVGVTKLDSVEGITTHQLKIDGMTLTGTSLDTNTADFQVNGVTFNQGQVTAQKDKGFVAGNSSFKEGSLIIDANNKLEATNGLTTQKATVTGALDVKGKATFGATGKQTTIEGDAITTDILKANKLILGASGDKTVEVDQDGSLIAAKGKFKVYKDGALKAADGAFKVDKDGKTNFKKDDNNLSSINGGNIWAKATDAANSTSSVLLHDSKGLHVKGNKSSQESAFDFDAATGISTFTGQDETTTTINGSAITSTKATGDTGVLDGSNLTLKKGTKQTVLDAGKVTFTGEVGRSNAAGDKTIIDGGIITTDTLNVQRIELGEKLVDSNGTSLGGNLSMDEYGNIKAAGGNFTVAGTDKGDDKGALHNEVGNTSFDTATTGATMKYKDGSVESKVTVEANKATVAAGDKASFVATTDNGGTATITGGTQTVTTTDKGTEFKNSDHDDPFVDNGATTTIINGNEITTGKITTDQLVIKGNGSGDTSGDGGESGSIAFGGDGTITSNIKDGANETTFKTTADGVSSEVNNGTYTSNVDQSADRIGSVITGGNVKIGSVADASLGVLQNGAGTVNAGGDTVTEASQTFRKDGSITSVAKDAAGKSSQLVQNGTGLVYTDSANTGNATRINSSDVSIGSATDPDKRINLSDLGQIDNLDDELKNRPEYKNGEEVGTAVGAINAEAGIRREEVARLDGRINDVNDRVNKVGAMAAAIASLKSIGYDPQAPSEFSIGLGQYKGETGVAMGFFHYPNKNFMINVSLSTAGGETMGGIGATWRFGHKSPQKLLEEQREAQAKKELAAAEKYQAAAKLAKEAQERAEYAAKLARQAQVSADNAKAAADATQAKHFG